jgi:hydroxymethylpyrimidine pyrophosphatase-like HAD family hydrolase
VSGKWIEERVLSNRAMSRALEFTASGEYQTVVMTAGEKFATRPRDEEEARTLVGLHGTVLVDSASLPCENVIRVTWFSRTHRDSAAFAAELDHQFKDPIYVTHFPLSVLADHRESPVQVLDIHPPCRGKAEALRYLAEQHGISAQEVVAVGDANNDLPMLLAAGIGVAMETGMPEAIAAADRVIGSNDSDAIADLIGELFALSV